MCNSKGKRALIGAAVTLLALILIALIIEFFYLPRYLFGNEKVTPSDRVTDEVTVMSCNVRYFNPLDLGKRSWFYRARLVAEDVNSVKPDIVGFQEVTWIHMSYLEDRMKGYDSVNAYRDDFILSEGCPIFYNTEKYTKVSAGSFWISETPEVMSKIEGAEHYRICVYVILRDNATGEEISVFNAHLDNKGERARELGIGVVLDKMAELGRGTSILLGDLNDFPDSAPIKIAFENLVDSKSAAFSSDDGATYHEWGLDPDHERIDYILLSDPAARVYEYRIVDNCHDGVYASDHNPIYIKFKTK